MRIAKIHEIVPDAAITTDIIAGFCSETEEDHQATLELMRRVRYDSAFMFQYSQRPGTKAARHFPDDVPTEVKTRRLNEIIELQSAISLERNRECIGSTYEVLIEGASKRDSGSLFGRTSSNKVCVFPALGHRPGEYVRVAVESCTSATLSAHRDPARAVRQQDYHRRTPGQPRERRVFLPHRHIRFLSGFLHVDHHRHLGPVLRIQH